MISATSPTFSCVTYVYVVFYSGPSSCLKSKYQRATTPGKLSLRLNDLLDDFLNLALFRQWKTFYFGTNIFYHNLDCHAFPPLPPSIQCWIRLPECVDMIINFGNSQLVAIKSTLKGGAGEFITSETYSDYCKTVLSSCCPNLNVSHCLKGAEFQKWSKTSFKCGDSFPRVVVNVAN